jgi:stage V sporulation protein B
MGIGAALKVVITYFLTGDPRFGINGAPIGTDVCYFVIFSLNLMVIFRVTGRIKGLFKAFLKSAAASVLMCGAAYGIWRLAVGRMGERTAVLPAILVGIVIYFAVMIFVRGICKNDFEFIAKNKKIRQIITKILR